MSFALDLQRFAEKAGKRADQVVGAVVVSVAKRIDERSPVGDATYWKHPAPKGYVGGHFRGNWQLGVDSVPSGEIAGADPSGAAAQGRIAAEIPEKASGKLYSLVNNAPYGRRIEDGWSHQAPQGVVGRTAIEFQRIVDEEVAMVRT